MWLAAGPISIWPTFHVHLALTFFCKKEVILMCSTHMSRKWNLKDLLFIPILINSWKLWWTFKAKVPFCVWGSFLCVYYLWKNLPSQKERSDQMKDEPTGTVMLSLKLQEKILLSTYCYEVLNFDTCYFDTWQKMPINCDNVHTFVKFRPLYLMCAVANLLHSSLVIRALKIYI